MDLVDSDKANKLEVKVWKEFQQILDSSQELKVKPELVERFQFYDRAKIAFCIIQTGYNLKFRLKMKNNFIKLFILETMLNMVISYLKKDWL